MRKITGFIFIFLIVFLLMPIEVTDARSHDKNMDSPFPEHPDIKSNVTFWKKVYSEFTTRQGIIHDNRNLDIIYQIIQLRPPTGIRNKKANRKKIKAVKKKYKILLKKLASGKKPVTETEKKVFLLFKDRKDRKVLKNAWKNIRFQLGQKDRFKEGIMRSGAYLDEIKKIMKSYGLPVDLAYLPHVESSFNYKAYSKFGAAGIWQFTRGTGKRYMKIDYTVDERRDPILSTYAAAKHLKRNYEKLGGWPFAITAYNHGVNGMLRARKKAGNDYVSIFNEYNGRLFGFASRNFYSEFIAAREVAKNYKKYFGDLTLHSSVKRVKIPLSGYVLVSDIADFFEVTEKQIRKLNPGLRKPVFNGQKYIPKGYGLYLPEMNGKFEKISQNIPKKLLKPKQKPSHFYRVQRGDTAGNIARREGIRLKDLILANQLNSRATIYVGQHLRIPRPEEKLLLAAVTTPIHKLKKQKKRKQIQKIIKKPERIHEKDKIDSTDISLSQGTQEVSSPIAALEDSPGPSGSDTQELLIAELEASTTASSNAILEVVNPAILTGHLEVEKIINQGKKRYGIISVEPEETLGHYADWLEVPTQRLRRINGLKFGKPIHLDQTLKIPLEKISKESFEERRYEYHKGIEEDFFSVYRVERMFTYQVKRGDNIWRLCFQKFDLPLWLLKKYNPDLNLNGLQATKKLKVPVVKKLEE
jgi:membrane-bound lytic murein transglycosylase D